ncbi:PPC domain-containing protein [Lentzea terrae]|uniref:PPC domain-containing protein n=1 Tax=Lentzea terrae TaxID=2200761 RepID=UPI0013009DF6|nr:PPC domain-containing protein [Lentzea terrae]
MRFSGVVAVTALVLSGQTAVAAPAPVQPDPLLAFLQDPGTADLAKAAKAREAKTRARVLTSQAPGHTYAEREPASARGRNDSPWTAELTGFKRSALFTGSLLADPTMPTVNEFAEPNDTQATAGDTGVGTTHRAIRTTGKIAQHDQDFYRLRGTGRTKLTTRTDGSDLDTVLTVFDSAGKEIASNDTVGVSTDARLEVELAKGADYFVRVTGTQNTSGSYELTLAAGEGKGDKDFFAIDLKAGDVIGASVTGAARKVVVHDIRGREVMASQQDFSGVYPEESPLPGGGNAVADHVAPRDGRYYVGVEDGAGRYELTVKAFRPGSEKAGLQTVFVDFNGALVDTSVWGAPGEKQLSPLKRFLQNWGLQGEENAVITAAVDTIRENLALHGKFGVRLLNSRDHADPWGQRNVSRLVIGGTIAESGVETVAIAQTIDPGNFGHEETALVQLDLLSAPAGSSVSLNTYLRPESDRAKFVGRALGNIAAHELGHLSGSWHQHQFNEHDTLMDQGGNPRAMFAVGADGVGGNADDTDIDFGEDHFVSNEGFSGLEDAAARTRWGYLTPAR